MKHVLVIGLGRFGRAVAEGLAQTGCEVVAVDTDMTLVEALRDRVAVAAQIDSLEPDAFRAIGAIDVDAAVVAIGEDFAAEILAVATLKELGIKEIVARANTDRERRILELVGATRIVSVEVEMGQRVARALVARDVVDHVTLAPGVSLIFWTADPRVIGHSLADSELRSVWQLNLVAVRPAGQETLEIMVKPDYVFHEGDVLLLIGPDAKLAEFTR
jgi:trk system potassium uptake protein TrkA